MENLELGYMESKDCPTPISDTTLFSSGVSLKQAGTYIFILYTCTVHVFLFCPFNSSHRLLIAVAELPANDGHCGLVVLSKDLRRWCHIHKVVDQWPPPGVLPALPNYECHPKNAFYATYASPHGSVSWTSTLLCDGNTWGWIDCWTRYYLAIIKT